MELEILNYLRVTPIDMLLVFISTLLIVWITKKFFWSYIKNYLDNRENYIKQQIESANSNLNESIETNNLAKVELNQIRNNANSIIEDAKRDAIALANKSKEDTLIEINNMKKRASDEIDSFKVKAILEIKDEISDIALVTASKIVKKELNDDTKNKYFQDFIKEVEKVK